MDGMDFESHILQIKVEEPALPEEQVLLTDLRFVCKTSHLQNIQMDTSRISQSPVNKKSIEFFFEINPLCLSC